MEAVEVGAPPRAHPLLRRLRPRLPPAATASLNVGYLSSAPVLFGLPPARVSHPVCARDGGDTCVYDIRWESGASRTPQGGRRGRRRRRRRSAPRWRSPRACARGGRRRPPRCWRWPAAASGASASAATSCSSRRPTHNADGAQRLESSLRDLVSDLRLDEVLEKITRNAQAAVGGKEFALLVDEGGEIACRSSSGLPAATTRALEALGRGATPTELDAATLIDDLTTHARASPRCRPTPTQPLRSLCAAPLVFRGERVGVLVALVQRHRGLPAQRRRAARVVRDAGGDRAHQRADVRGPERARQPRPAHRAVQPPRVPRGRRPRARALPPPRRRAGRRAVRPRRLQAGQRHARPRRRRPRAARPSPTRWPTARARATWPTASAATSSRCCCRTRAGARRSPPPSAPPRR